MSVEIKKEETVIIEDSSVGVKAGVAAGVKVIGLIAGGHWHAHRSEEELIDSGAFTAFTKGHKIDIEEYADFMKEFTYQWKDKVEHSSEILLLIKSIPENVQKCKDIMLKHHNYDTPELIVLDGDIIEDGYQAWFIERCRKI